MDAYNKAMSRSSRGDATVRPGATYRDSIECFTAREQEIIGYVTVGYDSEAVASLINVSKRTVDFHLVNVYAKTATAKITNRVQLALWVHNLPFSRN